jgi:hypothetical protein
MFSAVNTLITNLLVFVSPGLQQKYYDTYWAYGRGGGAYARSRIFNQVQTTAYTQENLDDSFLNKSRK